MSQTHTWLACGGSAVKGHCHLARPRHRLGSGDAFFRNSLPVQYNGRLSLWSFSLVLLRLPFPYMPQTQTGGRRRCLTRADLLPIFQGSFPFIDRYLCRTSNSVVRLPFASRYCQKLHPLVFILRPVTVLLAISAAVEQES
jgi:hypothetical protein